MDVMLALSELIQSMTVERGRGKEIRTVTAAAAEIRKLQQTVISRNKEIKEHEIATDALRKQRAEMLAALKAITERHVELAGSGDCGFWSPEDEPEVKQARAAIAAAEASGTGG